MCGKLRIFRRSTHAATVHCSGAAAVTSTAADQRIRRRAT
jgi:hypothetical protein